MDSGFDTHLYASQDKFQGYNRSIPIDGNDEEEEHHSCPRQRDLAKKMSSYTAPMHLLSELQVGGNEGDRDDTGLRKPQRIIDRENDYRKRRLNRRLSPPRHDPFAAGDRSPEAAVSTYADVMRGEAVKRAEHQTLRLISEKRKEERDNRGKETRDKCSPTSHKRGLEESTDLKKIKAIEEKRDFSSSSRRNYTSRHSSKHRRC